MRDNILVYTIKTDCSYKINIDKNVYKVIK